MSGWKAFTDLILQGDNKKSGGMAGAAIYGQNGAKWDEQDITVDTKEIDALLAGLKDHSKFQEKGIICAGVKYMCLAKSDAGQVTGKKGGNFILLRLTKTGIVIGVTKEPTNAGNVTMVDFVADDLIKKSL
jgi:hypothetical protein